MIRSMRISTVLIVTGLCLLLGSPASALFEELSVSPRALAMGEAGVAVSGDAWAFNQNPALLSLLDQPYGATSTVKPFGMSQLKQSAFGVAMPVVGVGGGLGFGFRNWNVGRGGTDLQVEHTFTVSHGFDLFSDASSSAHFGWALNFYNEEFGETLTGLDPGSAWTVGIDLGVMVTLHERTRAGFFTRNLNNPTIGLDAEELGQMVAGGIAYQPYDGVTTAFDIRSYVGGEFRFHGGMEIALTSILDLRMGVETDPNKLTGGFGINLPRLLSFDYAFITGGGVLDASHHFGLSMRFGGGSVEQ